MRKYRGKILLVALSMMLISLVACGEKDSDRPSIPKQEAFVQDEKKEQSGFSDLETIDWQGNEVDESIFSDYDLTMINIWATYCNPCLREMPDLADLNKEYTEKGVQIIGIVMDVFNPDGTVSSDMMKVVEEVVEKTGADYPHLLPSEDLIVSELRFIQSVPTTIFVDKDGMKVGETYKGAKSKEKWEKVIEETLEELKEAQKIEDRGETE